MDGLTARGIDCYEMMGNAPSVDLGVIQSVKEAIQIEQLVMPSFLLRVDNNNIALLSFHAPGRIIPVN